MLLFPDHLTHSQTVFILLQLALGLLYPLHTLRGISGLHRRCHLGDAGSAWLPGGEREEGKTIIVLLKASL